MKYYAGDKIVGDSLDTKPVNIGDGAGFFETDTLKQYLKVSGSWEEISASPGGSDTQLQFNNNGAFGGAQLEYTEFMGHPMLTIPETKSFVLQDFTGDNLISVSPTNTYLQGANTDFILLTGGIQIYSADWIGLQTETGLYDFFSGASKSGILDFTAIETTDKTFDFQNKSGTVALLGDDISEFNNDAGYITSADVDFTGSLAEGQIAFGTGANQIGGTNDLFWHAANKRLGVGTNNPLVMFHFKGEEQPEIRLERAVESPNATRVRFQKARGTPGSEAIVVTGDDIGGFVSQAYNGTIFTGGTAIISRVQGSISSTSLPSEMRFLTTASGSTTLTDRMILSPSGQLGLGTETPNTLAEFMGTNVAGVLTLSNSSTAITTGDKLGRLAFRSYDASTGAAKETASIEAVAEADFVGTGNTQTGLSFLVHTSSGSPFEAMRINRAGNVAIGSSTVVEPYNWSSQNPRFLQIYDGTSTSDHARFANLLLTNNQSGTGHLVGNIHFVNAAISATNKRIAQIAASTDGAIDSGRLDFVTNNAGSFATKMTIRADGKVGVGVDPSRIFHVKGSDNSLLEFTSSDTNSTRTATRLAHFTSGDMADGFGTSLTFMIGDNAQAITNIANITAIRDGADTTGALIFRAGSGGTSEFMRINGRGDIGIGTATVPQVTGWSANRRFMTLVGPGTADNSIARLELNTGATNLGSTGVGVGALDFGFPAQDSGHQLLAAVTADVDPLSSTNGKRGGMLRFWTKADNGSIAARIKINQDGNVGIGTDTPTVKLAVKQGNLTDPPSMPSSVVGLFQGSGHAQIVIAPTGSGFLSNVVFGDADLYNVGNISYNHSDDSMTFRLGGNDRANFTSTGILNLRQGTTASTYVRAGGTINSDSTSANTGTATVTQSETTLRTFSVLGNTLGTDNDLIRFKVTALMESATSDDDAIIRIKLGSQTIFEHTFTNIFPGPTSQYVTIQGWIHRLSNTTQEINVVMGAGFGSDVRTAGTQTLSSNQNFVVTGQTVVGDTSARVTYLTSQLFYERA